MQAILVFLAGVAIIGAAGNRPGKRIDHRVLLAMSVVLTLALTSRRFL